MLFSCWVMSNSLWPHGLQHARLPCPSVYPSLLKLMSIELVMLSNRLVFCHPLLLLPSFPASESFLTSQFFTSGGQSIGASALASVLPVALQGVDFFKDGLFWSPCSPRDSQESSLAPQFKSINSSALSLFYGPTLTSIHDHSFDYTDLHQKTDVSAFIICCLSLP